jgi:chemotaxis protein MotB
VAKKRPSANSGGWMLTYGDMITLLLVFFVLLWSMAQVDIERFRTMAERFSHTFGTGGGFSVLDLEETGSWVTEYSMPAELDMPMRSYDALDVTTELGNAVSAAGVEGDISIRTHMEGVIVSLQESLIFPPGGAELLPEGKKVLDGIIEVLADMPNPIRVEGHTDDRPTESAVYPGNWELSAARAISIVRYMEARGIEPERLSAIACGPYQPIFPNDTPENRRRNRRASLVIVYPLNKQDYVVHKFPELAELENPILHDTAPDVD